MADDEPLLDLFTCPNHLGDLRITPTTCAGMWSRARRDHEDALIRLAPCVGCQVGAGHAGVPVSASVDPGSGLSCVRCGSGTGRRLIGGGLCVSCYNRQREALIGRNARGSEPSQHRPLFCAIAGVVGGDGDVRPARVDMVVSMLEAMLRLARSTGATRFGRLPVIPHEVSAKALEGLRSPREPSVPIEC